MGLARPAARPRRAGYRAVAVDLRGYGGSDRPPTGYEPYTLTTDVAGIVRALGPPRRPPRRPRVGRLARLVGGRPAPRGGAVDQRPVHAAPPTPARRPHQERPADPSLGAARGARHALRARSASSSTTTPTSSVSACATGRRPAGRRPTSRRRTGGSSRAPASPARPWSTTGGCCARWSGPTACATPSGWPRRSPRRCSRCTARSTGAWRRPPPRAPSATCRGRTAGGCSRASATSCTRRPPTRSAPRSWTSSSATGLTSVQPVQAPVETGTTGGPAGLQRRAHRIGREGVARRRVVDRRREDQAHDPAVGVEQRAAGVAGPHLGPQGVDLALDRAPGRRCPHPRPGSRRGPGRPSPSADRRRGSRPRPRRRRAGGRGRTGGPGASSPGTSRMATSVAGSKTTTVAGNGRTEPARETLELAGPGHDVGVGHDPAGRHHEARPLEAAVAVGRHAEHLDQAVGRQPDARSVEDVGVRRRARGRCARAPRR